MAAKSAREASPPPAQPAGPTHLPFHEAHEAYIRALDEAWNHVQRQCLDYHLEFQQRAARLNRATTQEEFRQAQDGVQQMMGGPPSDPAVQEAIGAAFTQYKTAIKAALSEADLATLDPAALSAIGQSLSMIACLAQQAAQMAPPAKPT